MRLPDLPPINLGEVDGSTANLMREYALAYGAAVREECARLAESDEFYGSAVQHYIADAIRKDDHSRE